MATFRILRTDYYVEHGSLLSEGLLIGRATSCDLQLNHPSVQPFHAGILLRDDVYWLSALAEDRPILNGEPVKHALLADGDELQLGAYRLRLAASQEALQITVEFLLAPAPASTSADTASPREAVSAEAAALSDYWAQRLPAAEAAQTAPPAAPDFAWQSISDLRRRWPRSLAVGSLLLTAAGAVLTVLANPQVFSPAPFSAAHTRNTLQGSPAIANRASGGACTSCHTLTGSMQKQCAACHTTPAFQPDIGNAHLKRGVACLTCHTEHRGSAFQPASVANETCGNCHSTGHHAAPAVERPSPNSPHQMPVRYPVRDGVWSWDGLSQAEWQDRALPGRTADYNLREQFHLLHTQGRPQGRAQCGDCHLGGTEGENLKRNVREACVQCHRLHPELSAELAQLAALQPLKPGTVRCVACHAQHGAEKDLRASTRK